MKYKLVPVEPTAEMMRALWQAEPLDRYAAMLTAAPAVQGEPVGRVKTVGGYPDESEHTIEWLCKYKELKDGDLLYAAPQPAPEVAMLVEALKRCMSSMIDAGFNSRSEVMAQAWQAINTAEVGGEL